MIPSAGQSSRFVLVPLAIALALAGAGLAQTPGVWVGRNLTARHEHAMATDTGRNRIVLFGGETQAGWLAPGLRLDDTWEWDGGRWSLRPVAVRPGPRQDHAMAYDAARQRVVLFGGAAGPALADTWEWDGDRWTQRVVAAPPPARFGHSLAYDAARQRVVLFGGRDDFGSLFDDTWEWDGTAWSLRPSLARPVARAWHAATWDAGRQRMIVFGGIGFTWMNDTWEWDGSSWAQVPGAAPPARSNHALAFDPVRGAVVLTGGRYGSPTVLFADTWELRGGAWLQMPAAPRPDARASHALAFDAVTQRVVAFGGLAASDAGEQVVSDTWAWDGRLWTRSATGAAPAPRVAHTMAYDATRARMVLFGGRDRLARPMGDTWEWDGSAWLLRAAASPPGARAEHAMAYDAARGRTVLFGGRDANSNSLGDTWEWDGTAWQQATPGASPPACFGAAMAFDATRQRVVLFGGFGNNWMIFDATWEWDGVTWLQRTPAVRPPARFGHAMAYDQRRGRIVLFGGDVGYPLGDTWEWDGSTWADRTPAIGPDRRSQMSMTFDARRQRVVLFGGYRGGATEPNDTWEWDGATWLHVAPLERPRAMYASAVAFDAARGRCVLFGGASRQGQWDETWFYGDLVPAGATAYGLACAGSSGAPVLTGTVPALGETFWLEILSARASAPCVFALAGAQQNLALGGGCSLYVGSPLVTLPGVTDVAGVAALALPVPLDAQLRGGVVFAQGAIVDPLGAFAGLAFTAGRRLGLGD